MYNTLTEEQLRKAINDVIVTTTLRVFVVYCIDEKDGKFKNFEETQQFYKLLKKNVENALFTM